eukprot:PhM_4_TR590/c0_g1_i1/m.29933/K01689/ENO, eno; enolase
MAASLISKVHTREVLDSTGTPTIEVEITVDKKTFRAIAAGESSIRVVEGGGRREKRDAEDANRYFGFGMKSVVKMMRDSVASSLLRVDVTDQYGLDTLLQRIDGTDDSSKLGVNTMLAISTCVCRAGAVAHQLHLHQYIAKLSGNTDIRLPVPCFNVISGGRHAANMMPFQSILIAPHKAESFADAVCMGCEVYNALREILKRRYGVDAVHVTDDGSFAPPVRDIAEPLSTVTEAIHAAGYSGSVGIYMDCAATSMYDPSRAEYNLTYKSTLSSTFVSSSVLKELYLRWVADFPIVLLEDPFHDDDYDSWTDLNRALGGKVHLVGDTFIRSNIQRLRTAVEHKAASASVLKINQIGTLTEVFAFASAVMRETVGWRLVVSHRRRDSEDTFIADLAVGLGTGLIKTGAPCRGERVAKLNELLRIEEEMGGNAKYGCPGL